jgi:hypothetical protein
MEPDPTDPFPPPPDDGGSDEKDPMNGVTEPGWWALVGGVWRWVTEPLPNNVA